MIIKGLNSSKRYCLISEVVGYSALISWTTFTFMVLLCFFSILSHIVKINHQNYIIGSKQKLGHSVLNLLFGFLKKENKMGPNNKMVSTFHFG